MKNTGFSWANLDAEQISRLQEAERTLGGEAQLLLAYQPVGDPAAGDAGAVGKLNFARLDDSQLERLQGLERHLETLVIAYRQS